MPAFSEGLEEVEEQGIDHLCEGLKKYRGGARYPGPWYRIYQVLNDSNAFRGVMMAKESSESPWRQAPDINFCPWCGTDLTKGD